MSTYVNVLIALVPINKSTARKKHKTKVGLNCLCAWQILCVTNQNIKWNWYVFTDPNHRHWIPDIESQTL